MKDQKGNPNQIKPNELRIGNIISYSDGTHHAVSKFDDYKVWFEKVANQHGVKCWIVSNIEDVAPTPLTEELLLKCGFKECAAGDFFLQWGKRFDKRKTIEIELDWGEVFSSFWIGGGVDKMLLEIHSIHQLQNLFYALTGEELEIKL